MKLSVFALLLAAALPFAGCAAEQATPDDEAADVGVSQDELSSAQKQLVGNYEWRQADSGSLLDFERLELHADGTYSASVDSGLVDPNVRCVRFPCTLPEAGKWSTFKSGGKLKIRVRPAGHPSRSYFATKANDQLTLGRMGDTTVLFQIGVTTCANVRCASGTHCEMKGINGGAIPVCIKDAAPCVRGGCSGQTCADHALITTCDWRPEYACYQAATCERQADGTCGFTQTAALTQCLASH
jgi:hypothetical protein